MNILIVVDMQVDFTYGSLRNEQAIEIIPKIAEKVANFPGTVLYTRDTHPDNYLQTQEGRLLPVTHCVRGTPGWEIVDALPTAGCRIFDKPSFGSRALAEALAEQNAKQPIASIELVGVCTDICVISNAVLLKAFLPEVPICVDSRCCAGVTPESHENALNAMKMLQIEVK
ncbi:MAG: cysteine hydrolase [Firmicutes bacterium]|nr:cysteine hydrolase [Bacillota bacterium]